jgi:PKD repeat protein
MKKIYMILMAAVLSTSLNAQTIFWIENFNNGCSSLCTSYSGPNGAWTFSSTGPASACGGATTPNIWYISCAENGNAPNACGSGCGNNATLHVGNDPNSPSAGVFCPTGDCGAAYDAGGYCDILSSPPSTITDILAASPTIDCSGKTNITFTFNYIERGQGSNDNASVMYYDGATWSLLADMAKTPTTCGGGQGRWTAYSVALPSSADNNPNVAIAFHWVNDDDGTGNDPSFAVDSVRLTVPSLGAAPVAYFIQSATAGCDSLCVTFSDSSSGATSWDWSFPGGNPSTSTQQSPVVCYNTPGTFDVTQIVSNSFGTDTLVKSGLVTITATPIPDFNSSNQNLCVGDCIDYTDMSTGIVQTYEWTFQGGTPLNSSVQNPAGVCYNAAGFFNTTLTVSNGACTNSNTHVGYINVNQPTAPTITVNGDTLLSSPALTYQWYQLGVGAIPAGIFQFLIASWGESYYVCITDAAGCSSCSDTILYAPEGVHEFNLSEAFNVYPNPVHGKVVISNTAGLTKSTLQIIDVSGRMIKNESIYFIQDKAEMSVEEIAKGSYVLQLLDDKQQIIFSTQLVKN